VPNLTSVPPAARDAILAWYAERGRQLAFRRTRDPYAILVSEAMAQQTQAARAAAYWERFMERFPTVDALAAATPADVLRAWQGLGYDRRALALWRAARIVLDEHGGRIPSNLAELEALPGVGPYTARAVAALAFGLPVGAVDVNVRRVLGRIVAGDAASLSRPELQSVADESVPADRAGEWTHAVMDIGATLCRPRVPRCEACPARPWCRLASEKVDQASATGSAATGSAATRFAARATAATARAVREPAAPFASTKRWLRGRILDRLRAAPDGTWVALDAPIGTHDPERVRAAAEAMAIDGVLELQAAEGSDDRLRARLPLA
jgi:A/G-specific adenine glycosylase